MSTITLYPRFYTTRREGGVGVVVSKGDMAVVALNEFLVDYSINTTGWQYRKQILDNAIRLFGDFQGWLQDQLHNPRIVGYNLEFLKDTLQFIRTGQRDMCLANWIELVAEGNDLAKSPEIVKTKANHFSLEKGEDLISVIQRWCSHKDGIEDLAGTLNILFGQSRLPA